MELPIDSARPHAARMYDYYLGGSDHFEIDRVTAEKAMRSWPAVRTAVRANREFLGRAVRFLAGEAGVRQFLDIGAGLPSANNVHEVAQSAAPDCRVVYADNDPVVLAHARALLTGPPAGAPAERAAYIEADLRDPAAILAHPVVRHMLDFSEPIALMLVAVLHFLPDEDNPARIMDTLTGALPSGSYLVASHVTPEHDPAGVGGLERTYREGGVPAQARAVDDFTDLAFHGLAMVEPGVVLVSEWRPAPGGPRPLPEEVNWYGGVARKP